MLVIGLGIGKIQTNLSDLVYALLSGLNSATIGLIALAGLQLAKRAVSGNMTRVIVCAVGSIAMLYRCISSKFLS
jgi:chromate transport protein ChrA